MSEDQSLTDFSASEDASEISHDGEDSENTTPVEPATVTYRCRPDGLICTECGVETNKQWLDSGEFVCLDCKSWA